MEPENLKNGSEGVAGENISNLAFKNGNGSSLPVRNTFRRRTTLKLKISWPSRMQKSQIPTLPNLWGWLRDGDAHYEPYYASVLKMVKFLLKIL